jgi:hypothetical protein
VSEFLQSYGFFILIAILLLACHLGHSRHGGGDERNQRPRGGGHQLLMIISVDAEAEARRMIERGEFFRASLDNDPVATGTLAIDAAVKILAGSVIPRQIVMPGKMIARESKSQ